MKTPVRHIATALAALMIAGCASEQTSPTKTAGEAREAPATGEVQKQTDRPKPPAEPETEQPVAESTVTAADGEEAEPAPAADPAPTEQAESVADSDDSASGPPARPKSSRREAERRPRRRSRRAPKKDEAKIAGLMNSASRDNRRAQPVQPEATGTEAYENYGVNEMTESAKDRFSTFSVDVDTGSYTIARRKLNEGKRPPKASVRVEEFVNYFSYDYPSPDRGAFGVHLEAAPSPFTTENNTYLLRVGVQGKRISTAERKPVHLTFLVDVSGSMSRPDKLGLAQDSLEILTNNLQEGDTVALATYAGRVAEILPPTGIENRGRILEAIRNLKSGGGTGMNSGMELAYKLALKNHERDHVNRVIVLSDGDANIGPSSHQEILKRIRHFVAEGVTLSTIGFGMGNYKDTMMEQLANKGNGNYYYIDSKKEARKVFGDQIDGTLQVIAKDVKIQVEFDPEKVPKYRLIGYENRDIADEDFRDDKVDAGEIGAGHTVTALYEIELDPREQGKLAAVRVRHKKPDGYKAAESEFWFGRSDVHNKISDASKDFQFATAVAMFAEVLRESPYAKNVGLDLIAEVAKAGAPRKKKDRREFLKLVKKAKRLL